MTSDSTDTAIIYFARVVGHRRQVARDLDCISDSARYFICSLDFTIDLERDLVRAYGLAKKSPALTNATAASPAPPNLSPRQIGLLRAFPSSLKVRSHQRPPQGRRSANR